MPVSTPIYVCRECGQLHREPDGECMYECDWEMRRTRCNCMAPFDPPLVVGEHATDCPVRAPASDEK